ncbi:uncharacterized protein METZ01_LOCUS322320, partial [marine metagenome]
MSEDDKDNINIDNKEEETKSDENQSQGESSSPETQPTEPSDGDQKETQPKVDEKNEHEVIHKKDGRLHIYIRQDKYKGELKSKNWVGRLYIDGKQKISSSGTPNLEEAIPILEKWFDDIHANKGKEEQAPQETVETTSTQTSAAPVVETPKQTEPVVAKSVVTPLENKETSEVKTSSNILETFKNIKFKKPSFG